MKEKQRSHTSMKKEPSRSFNSTYFENIEINAAKLLFKKQQGSAYTENVILKTY